MTESESASDNQRPWQSYHTVYTNAKAGMDGVDKEKVQRIVYEMSKGSKYFENEERKEAFIRQKIEHMRARAAKLSATDLSHYQKARKFGVRAAMPGFIARKLCPELIFVPTDFKKYTYYSDLTRKVFRNYDPNFMAASLDEAYLDITGVCKEREITGEEIAEELRSRVHEDTGLTCSAGVAPNRLLAKVCSDINKPNGQFVLPNDRMAVMAFISSLPIRKIGGIGKVTENILRGVFGISTCEEMLRKGSFLCALFSRSTADFFLSVGLGLGGTDMPEARFRKSISSERTFSATQDAALLYQKLADIAEMLSADMQKEGLSGRTLTLKLKTASFEVRTRAMTLQKYICSRDDVLKYASKLLKAELPISLRLIGLRVSHFNEDKGGVPVDPTQKTLTTFLISEDASRRIVNDHSSLGPDLSDLHFMNERETALSMDSHETCQYEFGNPFESTHLPDMDDNNCISSENAWEMEKTCELSNNKTAAMVKTADWIVPTPKSPKKEILRVSEEDYSVQRESEDSNPDRLNKETSGNEEPFSSNEMKQLFWVDDYKCSLCGAELPSCFVEERQEHFDFHFAEKLQREESVLDSSALMPRQRIVPKDCVASQSRRKKQKSQVSKICYPNPRIPCRTQTVAVSQLSVSPLQSSSNQISPKTHLNTLQTGTKPYDRTTSNVIKEATISKPSMSDILASSRAQNFDLQLQTLGPFFRITAKSLDTNRELGRAEGLIRVWFGGRILHLDSIRLKRETLGMERSIFGIGLFIGAVAIRYGYDCGCKTAELLAINDSDLYHSKLVRFYKRIGFKAVHEVTGSTIGDMPHMLIWGGIGTRMDASVEELLVKWCSRLKSQK
ncbi:DNA polymerase kappa isoform X2 [Durio zibethinus]|uniref:DNA polymerase kappa n=1 Tax=Durio zibethinus TaxID=66656 RepID=A0A6P6AFD2_DURZI|nr:DNA polymerase kappa isoform X2 [Durio zibethinus]